MSEENNNQNNQQNQKPEENKQSENKNLLTLPASAEEFENFIKSLLGESLDIIVDKFDTKFEETVLVYIDGMTDKDLVDRDIIRPLLSEEFKGQPQASINASINNLYDMDSVIKNILDGNAIVYYAYRDSVFSIDFKNWDRRSVAIPEAENVNRGPKEGFTENLLTNLSMIRRKLKTPNLKVEKMLVGRQSNTIVCIVYLKGIVNQKVLQNVKEKISKIDTDAILESAQIEQLIEDKPLSIVSGIGLTQKPDIMAARLLEGRVAVVCDGTPHILTIPELFIETIHASEDYYKRTLYSIFVRFIRLFAMVVSILLPGFFVAILTYSHEMVPFAFFSSFIEATKGTPFPEAVELFFLAIMFELLREAGLRMPSGIGSSITIVGALILGDVAVSAGIVGAPSVIVIAITSVASLMIANLNEFVTLYRFLFLFLGSIMGIIGISAGIIIMLTQLISKESFGIPMLSSFSKNELKDSLIRFPLHKLNKRPASIAENNITRQNFKSGRSEQ